jgi:probable F420-dependent oxidoreductase
MQLNAIFPTRDIGSDPAKIRDWAQAAEDLGFAYIEVPDHVFGAAPRGDWNPTYNEKDPFHETFVMLGFLAAVTKRIGLSSGVLISPQRQTGLIAKQAAEVDLLSNGRLRLGIGVGWNHIEYEALGMEWKTRGARQAEQIEALRALWRGEVTSFDGRFHRMEQVTIEPPPVQRPIPIWMGGVSEGAIKRAARLADGWMPILAPDAQAAAKLALLRDEMQRHGRDPAKFGLEAWLRMHDNDPQRWGAAVESWKNLGAHYVMLYPMFRTSRLDEQIDMLRRFKAVADSQTST